MSAHQRYLEAERKLAIAALVTEHDPDCVGGGWLTDQQVAGWPNVKAQCRGCRCIRIVPARTYLEQVAA